MKNKDLEIIVEEKSNQKESNSGCLPQTSKCLI
jgi:hypothetical protein